MEAKSPYCRITPKSPFLSERSRTRHSIRHDVTTLNYPYRWGGQGHATTNYSNYQGLIMVKWHCYTLICMQCHFCWPWRKHSRRNAKMETLNGDEANRLDFETAFSIFIHDRTQQSEAGSCRSQSTVIIFILIHSSPAGTSDCWLNTAHLHLCAENPFHHISGINEVW